MTNTDTAITSRATKLICFRFTNVSRNAAVPVVKVIISLFYTPASSMLHEI